MSAKIIPFPNPKVDRDIVKMLEHQLALAKEGKIMFAAFAAVNDQGVAYSGWCPDEFDHQAKLTGAMGAVAFLNARFNEAVLIGADEGGPDDETPEAA